MSSTTALLITLLLMSLTFFETGQGDKCHRKQGVCKPIGGKATCMGVSRDNECRLSSWLCCYPPFRGRRRRDASRRSGQSRLSRLLRSASKTTMSN